MMWSLTGTKSLLFLVSPSTNFSVRDMRNHFQWRTTGWESSVFETKIDPKGRGRGEKGVCTSLKRFPERVKKGDCFFFKWATTERFQLPVTCREPQKTQPASKPWGTSKAFSMSRNGLEMNRYLQGKSSNSETKISSGQTGLIYCKGQVSWFPSISSHCDRNDSVMANLWTESHTEIWEARSGQLSNLQEPLPAL